MDPATLKVIATVARSKRLRRVALVFGFLGSLLPFLMIVLVGWLVFSLIASVITPNNTAGSELANPSHGVCAGQGGDSEVVTAADVGESLDDEQAENAAIIVNTGLKLNVPKYGLVVAIATALQESGLRNLNYGDRDSLGLFQQRPISGWGTPEQVRDPVKATRAFFGRAQHTKNTGLLDIKGWETMPVTVAAQAVQRSGFPDAYADDEPLAREVVKALTGTATNAGTVSASFDCTTATGGGTVVFPLPADSGYVDNDNYGERSSIRSGVHTGNDYSVTCGTPVLAAHGGTVVLEQGPGWFGFALVKISTGTKNLTTWYAHLQTIDVSNGQTVAPGDVLGQVGSEGNSTGCHLHFEVHPKNGSIYEHPIDPVPWLAEHVGKPLGGIELVSTVQAGTARIASFNVLGHSHTASGERGPGWDTGPKRMHRVVQLLDAHNVSAVGFQEFQPIQAKEFRQTTGDDWALFHDPGDPENAVAWRTNEWALEKSRLFNVPYFNGRIRRMPAVRLVHQVTGAVVWLVNIHNPADTRRYRNQGRWRREAIRIERALIEQLSQSAPVVVTGDFNDREAAFCAMTNGGLVNASAGGTNPPGGQCAAPNRPGIDWIFATPALTFTGHLVDHDPRHTKISDHPIVIADITNAGTAGGQWVP